MNPDPPVTMIRNASLPFRCEPYQGVGDRKGPGRHATDLLGRGGSGPGWRAGVTFQTGLSALLDLNDELSGRIHLQR
ncbi:MAG: hypothetical protein ACLQRH_29165 [Acidimicrobiales bacterium]